MVIGGGQACFKVGLSQVGFPAFVGNVTLDGHRLAVTEYLLESKARTEQWLSKRFTHHDLGVVLLPVLGIAFLLQTSYGMGNGRQE